MSNRKYFRIYNADINKTELTVTFLRLYKDGRDIMSDCLKPSWEAEDTFSITVTSWKATTKTFNGKYFQGTTILREEKEKFEIHTTSKKAANWIWYLAEKKGLSYEELKSMNETKVFG